MSSAFNLKELDDKITEAKRWLSAEFAGIRTGRATPALLDSIMVDSYGSRMAVSHVAAIGIEDARTLRITPWDKNQIGAIETAIAEANLGVSTSPDAVGLRVIFPDLTADRRKMLIKLIGEKLEEVRVSVRKERERLWTDIQSKERRGDLTEDDKFTLKDELQKKVDQASADFEKMADHKIIEIKS
ncbi:MAG: ribosome-recycling factor [Candidatus Paceibacterota bacterium]